MNKGLFLCGLFIALFLAGCGDDEVKIANQMTLYSRPDTIHLGGDLRASRLVRRMTRNGEHCPGMLRESLI